MERLTGHFELDVRTLDALLGVERCFDMIARDLVAGGRRCRLYVVDGYGDDAVLERMIGFWLALPSTADAADAQTFIDRYVTFSEVNAEADLRQTATAVFLGKTLLLAEGYGECILIDAKSYPSRGVEEPSSGKVLRGAHDGFIETLVQNAALLRRRIRTPQLTLEGHKISEKSRADVVLCYLEDKVDRALLARVRAKLAAIDANSISMSQESIAESMMDRRQWFNPFPRVRYTERPDAATASIMEGSIIVLVDNSPAAMILPTRFFDFVQEANDFYFPPLVGSYLRILRVVVFLLTLFITPVWYLLVQDPDLPNSTLSFLAVTSEYEVPILRHFFESRGNRKVLLRNADFIQKVRTWIESANQMDTRRTFNEFRQVIEVGIVKLACERATDEDIAAMATAVEHLKENPSKYEYDVEFHDSLAVASHNSMLAATIHLVNNLIADVRIRFWDLPDYQERTQQSHYAIYQAVCDRDVERAQLEMSRHLAIVDEFSEKYPGRSMGEEEPPIP